MLGSGGKSRLVMGAEWLRMGGFGGKPAGFGILRITSLGGGDAGSSTRGGCPQSFLFPPLRADAEMVLNSENKPLPLKDFAAPHLLRSEGTKPLPPGARRWV